MLISSLRSQRRKLAAAEEEKDNQGNVVDIPLALSAKPCDTARQVLKVMWQQITE